MQVALQPSEAQVLVVIVSLSLGFGVGAKICGSNSKPYHSMVARGGGGCRCANIHESITLRPPFSGLGLPLEILGNTRIRSTRIVDARLQPGPWFLPLNFHGSGQPYVRAKHPWRVYRVLFAYTVARRSRKASHPLPWIISMSTARLKKICEKEWRSGRRHQPLA